MLMGRTKEAVKARTKRRRSAKKSLYQEKQHSSAAVDDRSVLVDETVSISTSVELSSSHIDAFPTGTSELEGSNNAVKESPVDKKLRVLKKLLNPKEDPYYHSDPLARAFCEWRAAKRKIQLLESSATTSKKLE